MTDLLDELLAAAGRGDAAGIGTIGQRIQAGGTPVVRDACGGRSTVTFFWRGPNEIGNVMLFSFGLFPIGVPLTVIEGTDIWFHQMEVAS